MARTCNGYIVSTYVVLHCCLHFAAYILSTFKNISTLFLKIGLYFCSVGNEKVCEKWIAVSAITSHICVGVKDKQNKNGGWKNLASFVLGHFRGNAKRQFSVAKIPQKIRQELERLCSCMHLLFGCWEWMLLVMD